MDHSNSDEKLIDISINHDSDLTSLHGSFQWLTSFNPLGVLLYLVILYTGIIAAMYVTIAFVFGHLHSTEKKTIKDKMKNFLLHKLLFHLILLTPENFGEMYMWLWFNTFVGTIIILGKLSDERYNYLAASPSPGFTQQYKVIGLLTFLIAYCGFGLHFCLTNAFSFFPSKSIFHIQLFMLLEGFVICSRLIHILSKYCIRVYDEKVEIPWEHMSSFKYYIDLIMEMISYALNGLHHLHMLYFTEHWFSVATFIIFLQLRFFVLTMLQRYQRHKTYKSVVANMESQFTRVTSEELKEHNDRCAICWEQMHSALKLPCGHLYHSSCLRSWLQQNNSCPTCRKQFNTEQNSANQITASAGQRRETTNVRFNDLVRNLQEAFPFVSARAIASDLQRTRSLDATTNNILDGRLTDPPIQNQSPTEQFNRSAPTTTPGRPPSYDLSYHPPAAAVGSTGPSHENYFTSQLNNSALGQQGMHLRRRNVPAVPANVSQTGNSSGASIGQFSPQRFPSFSIPLPNDLNRGALPFGSNNIPSSSWSRTVMTPSHSRPVDNQATSVNQGLANQSHQLANENALFSISYSNTRFRVDNVATAVQSSPDSGATTSNQSLSTRSSSESHDTS